MNELDEIISNIFSYDVCDFSFGFNIGLDDVRGSVGESSCDIGPVGDGLCGSNDGTLFINDKGLLG